MGALQKQRSPDEVRIGDDLGLLGMVQGWMVGMMMAFTASTILFGAIIPPWLAISFTAFTFAGYAISRRIGNHMTCLRESKDKNDQIANALVEADSKE